MLSKSDKALSVEPERLERLVARWRDRRPPIRQGEEDKQVGWAEHLKRVAEEPTNSKETPGTSSDRQPEQMTALEVSEPPSLANYLFERLAKA